MTHWARGFLWGAVLASAGMLTLPALVETILREGWRNRNLADVIVVESGSREYGRPIVHLDGQFASGTHVEWDALGMWVERKESSVRRPPAFVAQVDRAHRAMVVAERLCPIVVLATPDEIRISPCLARVGAR